MITIEDLSKAEQQQILKEIRQWEEETNRKQITEEDLERMAQEQFIHEMQYGYCEPMDELEIIKMKKESGEI